ncbi:hypothetical protein Q0Q51_01060 [Escherichia coli]
MIRRASVASGMVHPVSDAARTPYPTYRPVTLVGMIRRASVASGMVHLMSDAARTPYLGQLLYA